MCRLLGRVASALPIFAALMMPWSVHAKGGPTLEKATLTGGVTAYECRVTTYDGSAVVASQLVPCDVTGTSFTLAANQGLQVSATYAYHYQDDGASFASGLGVVADCSNGRVPCVVDPAATHEYGDLRVGFMMCRADGTCFRREYFGGLMLVNGPDDLTGQVRAVEIDFPGSERTVSIAGLFEASTFSTVTAVPEPGVWVLLVIGLIAIRLRTADQG